MTEQAMDVLPPQRRKQRASNGRWLPGIAPAGARPFQKGQAPNPTGKGGDYHEALKLARRTSVRSITRLIELRESDDQQIAIVASKALWEISWGKPRDFDPSEVASNGIDFAKMSDTDLAALIGILRRSSPAADVVGLPVEDEGEVIDNKK